MKQNYITTLISIDHLFFLKKNQVFTKEQGYFWGQTRVTYYWVASIITYCYISYVIDIASDNKDNNWWYVTSYCDKTGKSDKSVNTSSSIYELSVNVLTGNIKFWKQTSNLKNNIKFWKHHDHNRKLCHALWWLEDSHWCNMHTFVIGNWFFLW